MLASRRGQRDNETRPITRTGGNKRHNKVTVQGEVGVSPCTCISARSAGQRDKANNENRRGDRAEVLHKVQGEVGVLHIHCNIQVRSRIARMLDIVATDGSRWRMTGAMPSQAES